MKDKKKKNNKKRVREKKSLRIVHRGDTVVIRNRSAFGGAVLGTLMIAFCAFVLFVLKEAWDKPVFWAVYLFILVSALCAFVNSAFGKIFLDAPRSVMTVCGLFKREYPFDRINYVDLKESKPKDGLITHTVTVYIGNGRRKVQLATCSKTQAAELVSLLRGMLDNAAMVYPEGDDEPFDLSDDKDDFTFLKRKKSADAPEKKKTQGPDAKDERAKDNED